MRSDWMKTGVRTALLACLLLFAVLAQAAGDRLPLWEVSGARGKVYLFGTIHACRAGCYPLPEPVLRRFDAASTLVLELDMRDVSGMQKLAMAMRLPAGQRLSDRLEEADRRLLAGVLQKLGPDAQFIDTLHPWAAGVNLVLLAAQRAGYHPAQGVEMQLLAHAQARGKGVLGLETAERQLAALSAGSEAAHIAALRDVLREVNEGHLEAQMEELVQAWKVGDLAGLAKAFAADLPQDQGWRAELLDRRNIEMADALAQRLSRGEHLFVGVGFGHLVGPGSLPELLEKRGFSVRQIPAGR